MALRVGMVGQIVLDTIHLHRGGVVEDLGGLTYSIMAMDSLMDSEDVIVPITRVGQDAIERVRSALGRVTHLSWEGVIEDDRPNNRVDLRYKTPDYREERASGGVAGLTEDDLGPAETLDGLLINLVSGREAGPSSLSGACREASFPVHLDLHSYLVDYDRDGKHYMRRPEGWEGWLGICDTLQVNREEFFTIAGRRGEVFDIGEEVWEKCRSGRVTCLLVTVGERGSFAWYADKRGGTMRCYIPPMNSVEVVDPTGSGDVYGASFFLARLRGESIERSMILARRMAGLNCTRSGTAGLNTWLRELEGDNRESHSLHR